MAQQLERTTFETSRLMEFFSEQELAMQIGSDAALWPLALVKELIDNALDACESAGVPPQITVTVTDDSVTVTDNGPGMPPETLERSLDYLVRVSDKQHYVSPTRGQLGNAFKCIWAAVYVATGQEGRVEVHSGDRLHVVTVGLNRIAQTPELSHEVLEADHVQNGTSVKIAWPDIASYLGADFVLDGLLKGYAAFNPHASFTRLFGGRRDEISATDPGWQKWRPADPTSPHWYRPETLRNLIAAYLTASADKTLREFIAEFRGLSRSATQKALTTPLGLTGARLSDLVSDGDVSLDKVARLLAAMQRESRPVKPAALGILGREHLTQHMVVQRYVDADSVRYKKVEGTSDGLPFVLEVALGVYRDEYADYGSDIAVGLNFSATFKPPIYLLTSLLGEQRIDTFDPVAVLVHLACPALTFMEHSKGSLALAPDVLEALAVALRFISKDWKKAKIAAGRKERVQQRELEKMRKVRHRPVSIKEAAYEWMETAYLKASADNSLPANARQIMYALRPYVLAETGGKCWSSSSYFTQTLLPDFMKAYETDDWNVVFDARGHFQEPHDGARVDLGTLDVCRYLASRAQDPKNLSPASLIATGFPTVGPENRYDFALFIEKEGFDPLLKAAHIAERFDIAIMSTKGMSSTAARTLVEKLSDRAVTILVAHDFDKAGLSILETLRSDTRRYQFASEPNVVDIGLRLSDVEAMELQSEPVDYGKDTDPRDNLFANGASVEEVAYLAQGRKYGERGDWQGQRVELNALPADLFVSWLETKLTAAGVSKVVPNNDVLAAAYRRAVQLKAVQETIEATIAGTDRVAVAVPDDLAADVLKRIDGTAQAWDDALWEIMQGSTTAKS
jgi:DNA topoisomerase VI subunit B